MYRAVFELIRKNASRERQVDDVSDSEKLDMRAFFHERCRNRIHITIWVRRLREEFRNVINGNTTGRRKVRWSKWRRKVRRGRNTIDK